MILSCQSISKSFGTDEILKDVSFHIEANEKAAIVGINGAGNVFVFDHPVINPFFNAAERQMKMCCNIISGGVVCLNIFFYLMKKFLF